MTAQLTPCVLALLLLATAFYDPAWRHLRLAWGEPFGIYLPLAARSQ